MDIRQAMATDLTDSVGATKILSKRFNKPSYSVDSLHQLVKHNKLRAFMFHEGQIIERTPGSNTRGKDLLFLYADLYALSPPRKAGRQPVQRSEPESHSPK